MTLSLIPNVATLFCLYVCHWILFISDKNGGDSHGYEFRKPVNRMALDDVITADKTDIGYVDIDWDIIQQEKDKLVNSTDMLKFLHYLRLHYHLNYQDCKVTCWYADY